MAENEVVVVHEPLGLLNEAHILLINGPEVRIGQGISRWQK